MPSRVLTLAKQSLVYGLGSVATKIAAVILLPLYTHYLSPADYGRVDLVMQLVAAASILGQLGLTNSVFRYYYDHDDEAYRRSVFRTSFTLTAMSSTLGAIVVLALSHPIAHMLFGSHTDAASYRLVEIGALGLWIQTNYAPMAVLFRAQQRPVSFSLATLANLCATVAITVTFVVGIGMRSSGLLLGNFLGSVIVYIALLILQRRWIGFELPHALRRGMLAFGLPLVPAGAALWAVNAINRPIINALVGATALGLFAIALKLAQGITLLVQAFQLSWPAFAHSIRDDNEARSTYATVMSLYAAGMAWAVIVIGLAAPWLIRLLTSPRYYAATPIVLPLAIGSMLYGSFFVIGIGASRAKKMHANWVVSGIAAGIEVILLFLLIPHFGVTAAGWSVAAAFFSMFVLMARQSNRHFHVPWQWLRLLRVAAISTAILLVAGLLIGEHGNTDLGERVALMCAYPIALGASGFFNRQERRRLRRMVWRKPVA